MALLGDKTVFGDNLEELQVTLSHIICISKFVVCNLKPAQATILAFEGFRINPHDSFIGRDVGAWTEPSLSNLRPDVENEILKHREWLTYILCLADGGPKWTYNKSQFVSRAS